MRPFSTAVIKIVTLALFAVFLFSTIASSATYRNSRYMSDLNTCPKCSGEMERGFILERSLNDYAPNVWVEGPPESSFWTQTKISGKVKRLVESHRCVNCGFLESYATQESK